MKKIIIFLILIAQVFGESPKCHNCNEISEDSAEHDKIVHEEWLNSECVCENPNLPRQEIPVDDLTVYCCHKKLLQRNIFKRAWDAIKKAFRNGEVRVNYQQTFK
ncbi:hypothetical protein PVAND_015988 [Polypedilum vanderplanki]|uniref:Uncharacterized protein n=1 Tax=Polypedilum vanderplanki TaxID=319348 RepID=A0A9J6BEJ0_POLVA|nr:hypothetical protein PVAND_015988 [Polypedilum vanderplanki]